MGTCVATRQARNASMGLSYKYDGPAAMFVRRLARLVEVAGAIDVDDHSAQVGGVIGE
jgi:hypothetical protein